MRAAYLEFPEQMADLHRVRHEIGRMQKVTEGCGLHLLPGTQQFLDVNDTDDAVEVFLIDRHARESALNHLV